MSTDDLALQPAIINTQPGWEYESSTRRFQGIPGIERTSGGRLWATWYGGGDGEDEGNYVVLATSDDDGTKWRDPILVIDLPGHVRAFDPCLWIDPEEKLWLFWSQSVPHWDGRAGVWCINSDDPESETPKWFEPRRLTNGVMMNKPTVLSSGEWLLPTAVWRTDRPDFPELDHERFSNVLASYDSGRTFSIIGGADVPNRWGDEHMIVERNDRTLWMLVRTRYGIGESISNDRGHTWSDGQPTDIKGPDSRFYIRRLISGNLLLVNHDNSDQRTNMTAYLSQDDGKTWQGGLLLDGRDAVSYPDGTQSEDGLIYIIYDRSRREDMEILIAIFREEDILAEKPISGEVRLHVLCNKGG